MSGMNFQTRSRLISTPSRLHCYQNGGYTWYGKSLYYLSEKNQYPIKALNTQYGVHLIWWFCLAICIGNPLIQYPNTTLLP